MAYLDDTPYQVDIAETGRVACEMFVSSRYDLVLTDRQMPVMDGRAIGDRSRARLLARRSCCRQT